MFIIALLYILIVWLVFAKLKWLRWGWGTGTATILLGLFVAALFAGFLSYLAPTGRVIVISRVVEVTPNVSGQITEIPVKANELVKANTVLFKIDATPYDAQVRTIEAQLGFQELRLSQMKQLQASSAGRAFDVDSCAAAGRSVPRGGTIPIRAAWYPNERIPYAHKDTEPGSRCGPASAATSP